MTKTTTRLAHCLVVAITILVTGCVRNHYEIELQPTDKGMNRTLSCYQGGKGPDASFPNDELTHIAAVYGAEKGEEKDGMYHFVGAFEKQMPDDVGGSGQYRHWDSPLGSVSVYAERFRGNDDLLSVVERQNEIADWVVDHVVGWMSKELNHEDRFEHLQAFLRNDFRRDVKNLALYVWSISLHQKTMLSAEEVEKEIEQKLWATGMRVAQYLVEREYFGIDELPQIARAMDESQRTEHVERILKIVQRLIAAKMGVEAGDPIPKCLNFIGHQKSLELSMSDYFELTDDYKRLVQQWEQSDKEEPKPKPIDTWAASGAMKTFFQFGGDVIELKLNSSKEPFATNGRWDNQEKKITWKEGISPKGQADFDHPAFAFALWAEPNEKSQVKHFGKVILDAEPLAQYCLWHQGLSDTEKEQWETFLSSIKPGTKFAKELKTFRFSHEPPAVDGDKSNKDLAAPVRGLILAGSNSQ